MDFMSPSAFTLDLATGEFPDAVNTQTRRLSDMRGYYADRDAEAARADENPLIYSVYEPEPHPVALGMLSYSTTVILPGTIGSEYFMTKGHYHAKGDRTELYYGILGDGVLQLQTREGDVRLLEMRAGTAAFVPPYWAHRTMNVGDTPFAFIACFPNDAGYDYETIAEKGFAQILVRENGKPALAPNPYWR
jgi:glucose-6-phosphate isomerase, archaeal